MKGLRLGWLPLFVLTLACANRQDVVAAKLKGRGTPHVYPVTVGQAWTISKTILRFERTDRIDEHRSEGYMLTAQDGDGLAPGTYLGVFIEPTAGSSSKITFVAKRRSPAQAYAGLTEDAFHKRFAALLELITAVGPLPAETPPAGGADGPRRGTQAVDAGPDAPDGALGFPASPPPGAAAQGPSGLSAGDGG